MLHVLVNHVMNEIVALPYNDFCDLVCGRPLVSDGIDKLALKRVYEIGEEVTLTCERGYLPSTTSLRTISCTATGEWTRSDLACSREFTLLLP